jgi:hypothetical protein
MRTAVRTDIRRRNGVFLTLLVTVTSTVVTLRLYASSPLDRDDEAVVADALPRLAFLRDALDAGARRTGCRSRSRRGTSSVMPSMD